MVQCLIDEVVETVVAQIKSGDFPKEMLAAAVNETPRSPAVSAWAAAQIRQTLAAGQTVDISAIKKAAHEDELLSRRMRELVDDLAQRLGRKLIDREFDRRLADGSIIEVVLENGETGYERKEE